MTKEELIKECKIAYTANEKTLKKFRKYKDLLEKTELTWMSLRDLLKSKYNYDILKELV